MLKSAYQAYGEWNMQPEIGRYFAWGIRFGEADLVPDLSVDEATVAGLAGLFNKACLSPYHLREAIEDWLAEV